MKKKIMVLVLAASLVIGSSMTYSYPVLAAEQTGNEISSIETDDVNSNTPENDIISDQNVQEEQDNLSENKEETSEALQEEVEENTTESNIDALEENGNSLEEETTNTNIESGQDGSAESVQSEESTEMLNSEEESQEEIIGEGELKENSWRYQNGERINTEESNRTRAVSYPYAWEKVNGQYVNNKGEVIPNAVKKGIDVSEHNGTIDWEKVKADGIDFAIIRCGYGSDDTNQDDDQWARNVAECERLGIPYGVYLYSYANTLQKAESEAQHVLRLLQGHSPSFPIYYDLEDILVERLSSSMKGQIAQIFCDKIAAAGYKVGIYSNLNWWTNFLKDPAFNNTSWSKWVAQYNSTCDYTGEYDMWQCTSVGRVDGIGNGNGNVDLNFWLDANALEGLQYNAADGNWYMYKNGTIDTSYTGLASNENGWWYVRNGAIDWNYTGFAQNANGWWYVRNGGIDWNYTSVEFTGSEWWYVKNGEVDWDYTGVAQNANGWWYIKNGKVDWGYTGLASNANGWWYIRDGGVDWNYTGFAENENGLWYVRGGGIDWNYTSVEYTGTVWLYIENGGVNWNYTGLASNANGWWYIKNGQVDWGHTGLESNANGWWYVKNGGIDWDFTGVVQNAYGWWYINGGGVDWNYTGSVKYNGKTYSVVGGEVMI